MAHVLDLGCGAGGPPVRSDFSPGDDVTGVDIDEQRLVVARQRFRSERFTSLTANRCHFPTPLSIASFPAWPFLTWTFPVL